MTTEERFEKIEAGIRDLIVVSRTVLDSITELRETQKESQKRTDEMFNALIQAQRESEEKISRLSATVDKLIRFQAPNGQNPM